MIISRFQTHQAQNLYFLLVKFTIRQITCGGLALVLTTSVIFALRYTRGGLCSSEGRSLRLSEWNKYMSQCVCAVHDLPQISNAGNVNLLHFLAPAYNALALIFFFAGAIYNVACKFCRQWATTYTHRLLGTSLAEETPDQTYTRHFLKRHKSRKLSWQSHASMSTRQCVCCVYAVSLVFFTQTSVFFMACLLAVLANAWWIEV